MNKGNNTLQVFIIVMIIALTLVSCQSNDENQFNTSDDAPPNVDLKWKTDKFFYFNDEPIEITIDYSVLVHNPSKVEFELSSNGELTFEGLSECTKQVGLETTGKVTFLIDPRTSDTGYYRVYIKSITDHEKDGYHECISEVPLQVLPNYTTISTVIEEDLDRLLKAGYITQYQYELLEIDLKEE